MPERRTGDVSRNEAPAECANCGTAIPRGSRSCPECGADERTGWRETSVYDNVDLPDEVFDDERSSVQRRAAHRRVNGIAWYWWCIGVAVAFLLVLATLRLI
jgi:hypothetical protein